MTLPRILVDTNVWIDHFRRADSELVFLLEEREVLIHPLIVGELACGNLQHRAMLMEFLADLPECNLVDVPETVSLVNRRKLFGLGIGIVDAVLLAATMVTPNTLLWTRDRRLARIAAEAGIAFTPTSSSP